MEIALIGDFEGAIRLRYNKKGLLIMFHIFAKLTDTQYSWLISNLPLRAEHVEPFVSKTSSMKALAEDKVYDFEHFWNQYDYKQDKAQAVTEWYKLDFFDKVCAVHMSAAYDRELEKSGVAKLYPVRYLKNRRFESVKL